MCYHLKKCKYILFFSNHPSGFINRLCKMFMFIRLSLQKLALQNIQKKWGARVQSVLKSQTQDSSAVYGLKTIY